VTDWWDGAACGLSWRPAKSNTGIM